MKFCYYFLISILTDQLKDICKEYFERMYLCEGQKWDLEHEVRKRDWEVLPKIKTKQKYTKKQNIYKKTLILFDEMKNKNTNKLFVTHFFFLNFDNFILIPKPNKQTNKNTRVFENHEKVKIQKKSISIYQRTDEFNFHFFHSNGRDDLR
jgi:Cft2 family RNA processing exonuclease